MQTSVTIKSIGDKNEVLDRLLREGWNIHSITANPDREDNDMLVKLWRDDGMAAREKFSPAPPVRREVDWLFWFVVLMIVTVLGVRYLIGYAP